MVPKWSYSRTVPLNLSIKNVPDDVVERLRERAKRHHRSLQGELLDLVAAAADERPPITARDAHHQAKATFGTYQPTVSIADEIRRMRDERTDQLVKVMRRSRGRR
jgi:plasmid stability protein